MTKDITAEHVLNDLRYLTLLARSFPTVADASTEIINLEAILNLPKGRSISCPTSTASTRLSTMC